ncbi:SDR family oxidoreductase [Acidisoma cellulosilytica]|uniref:SDR family oxidoreductase n=1 Tax=Acidisoma cellulosilyticum TaxID=2802395 RepID=A0A963Z1S4_9PROT|nr:SDR family oxidoreductase [Acidisoma cellulosilyticum]MCB8881272.1 SDR family oxidoreductase [Acidisoma cellulosilyticum]
MRLKGKIAVVTGGSQGIGAAISERFAAEGASVFVVASASLEKAQLVVDRIKAAGGDATAAAADVAQAAELGQLMQKVGDRLDILVNSAGVFYPTPVGTPESDIGRMIDINLKGSFLVISAAAPVMKAAKSGKIINLSSCAGVMGLNTYSVYCATKAGIMMMTRALALELAPFGINVNAIAPGNTATPINEDIRMKPEFAGFLQSMTERTPSGQTYSSVEDIANLAVFLASDESRAMHGSTVLMDEGFTAGL